MILTYLNNTPFKLICVWFSLKSSLMLFFAKKKKKNGCATDLRPANHRIACLMASFCAFLFIVTPQKPPPLYGKTGHEPVLPVQMQGSLLGHMSAMMPCDFCSSAHEREGLHAKWWRPLVLKKVDKTSSSCGADETMWLTYTSLALAAAKPCLRCGLAGRKQRSASAVWHWCQSSLVTSANRPYQTAFRNLLTEDVLQQILSRTPWLDCRAHLLHAHTHTQAHTQGTISSCHPKTVLCSPVWVVGLKTKLNKTLESINFSSSGSSLLGLPVESRHLI